LDWSSSFSRCANYAHSSPARFRADASNVHQVQLHSFRATRTAPEIVGDAVCIIHREVALAGLAQARSVRVWLVHDVNYGHGTAVAEPTSLARTE
jgi:hypothetical protein